MSLPVSSKYKENAQVVEPSLRAPTTQVKINAQVVELVDTLDLKSNDHRDRAGSSPALSTKKLQILIYLELFLGQEQNLGE